ncbi:4-hydroxybenzoyl-CoA thioesterase, partial [Cellulomonas sp. A375-1]
MARLEIPVQLRWSDMDAYAHVNNVEMLRLLEEARIEVFWQHPVGPDGERAGTRSTAVIDAGPGAQVATFIAHQEIQYVKPLGYRRAPVVVELWIGHL